MNLIREHIENREWTYDSKEEKKNYYFKIAEKCSKSEKIEDLVSGTLIYNQLIEQSLIEAIVLSIVYVKTKMWPNKIEFNIDFEKATFGKQIEYFEKFAVEEVNRDVIIRYLKDILKIRNKVIHRLFDIKNFNKELEDYFGKAHELFMLLIQYYNDIAEHILYEFEGFDFDNLLK